MCPSSSGTGDETINYSEGCTSLKIRTNSELPHNHRLQSCSVTKTVIIIYKNNYLLIIYMYTHFVVSLAL